MKIYQISSDTLRNSNTVTLFLALNMKEWVTNSSYQSLLKKHKIMDNLLINQCLFLFWLIYYHEAEPMGHEVL